MALGILYRRVPKSLRPRLIHDALDEAQRGEIDLSGLWVARRRGKVVGALLTQILAGRAAAVWPPEVALPPWSRGGTAAHLLRAALSSLADSGVILAQALLDESSGHQAVGDLIRGGMPQVTELVSLERSTHLPLPHPQGVPTITWICFDASTEPEFRRVLLETYEGSLDMPELEGIRSLDDIISGHKAGGRFRPERWQLGRVEGEDNCSLVLLMSEIPERNVWEVAYLGLTPSARGRGLAQAALSHAIEEACQYVPRLELAVDVRNRPAARLYTAVGFQPFDRRAVHLVRLSPKNRF